MYSPAPSMFGGLRFQRDDVLLVQPQLGRVFDRDDAFLEGNEAAQHVEHRRLAGARAAADEDVAPGDYAARRNVAAARLMLPISMQIVHRQPLGGELADGEARPLDGQRRNDGVHARAVGQPGIDQRLALVDPPPDLGHDPLDDRLGHLVRNESPAAALDDAVALDVNLVAADDHDFGDRRCAEQILQRAEAEDDVLEVFLQRPQDHVLPQLVVQVRADEMEDVVEAAFHAMHLLAHVAARRPP